MPLGTKKLFWSLYSSILKGIYHEIKWFGLPHYNLPHCVYIAPSKDSSPSLDPSLKWVARSNTRATLWRQATELTVMQTTAPHSGIISIPIERYPWLLARQIVSPSTSDLSGLSVIKDEGKGRWNENAPANYVRVVQNLSVDTPDRSVRPHDLIRSHGIAIAIEGL